jgi:mono/diheme cytochrome c family protein
MAAVKPLRRIAMRKTTRSQIVLAVVVSLAGVVGFAQSAGEATYKAKCQTCHGATGLADSPVGRALNVKPITDPAVRRFTEAAMIDATRNGMGKMQAFKDKLTDAEIRASVAYFRALAK